MKTTDISLLRKLFISLPTAIIASKCYGDWSDKDTIAKVILQRWSSTDWFVVLVCNFICHDRCRKHVISPCSSIAPILIKVSLIESELCYCMRSSRIPCVTYGRMYPGSSVNFAIYVENDLKISQLSAAKVCSPTSLFSICIVICIVFRKKKKTFDQVIAAI